MKRDAHLSPMFSFSIHNSEGADSEAAGAHGGSGAGETEDGDAMSESEEATGEVRREIASTSESEGEDVDPAVKASKAINRVKRSSAAKPARPESGSDSEAEKASSPPMHQRSNEAVEGEDEGEVSDGSESDGVRGE